jgi:predicted AAA+ superfamily ATPase
MQVLAKKENRACISREIKYYIQSAFSLSSSDVYFREKESISKINDFNKKIIIVRDPIAVRRDGKGIETIGAVEFLLNENYLKA